MGQYEYGVFAYTWVWFLVFSAVATLGFGDSPVRYIAQLRERGETAHLRGFIRFAPLVILVASIAFAALLIAVLPLADGFIDHAYLMPMALMAVSIPFACLQSFLEGVGRSYNWTIPALLPVYIIRHGLLLIDHGWRPSRSASRRRRVNGFVCLVLTMVLSIAYQAIAILRRLRRVVERGPRAYRPREWLRGSAPFAVLYGAQHLSSFADVLVLSFFVSPAEIAIYFAATRIIQVVNLVPYAATVGTAHLFSASHTRGDHDELQRLVPPCRGRELRHRRDCGRHHRCRRRLAARHVRPRLRGRLHAARHPRRRRAGARRRRAGRGHPEHDRPRRRLRLDLSRGRRRERGCSRSR